MLAEKELLIISKFKNQEIFIAKELYDNTLLDFLKKDNEISTSMGKSLSLLLSMPVFIGLIGSSVNVYISIIASIISALLIYPFAAAFGQSPLVRGFNKLFNVFSIRTIEKRDLIEKEMLEKREYLNKVILSKETKEFFSKLYVYLEQKLHHAPNKKDKEYETTLSLYKKIKKIIEAYLEENQENIIQKIIAQLKNTEKEINQELNKDVEIKNFIQTYTNKTPLNSNYTHVDEKLFKKDKYNI